MPHDRAATIAALTLFLSRHHGPCTVHVDTETAKDVMVVSLPAQLPPGLVNDCQRDIFLTLQESGRRLTTTPLIAEMEKRGRKFGESWVKENLSDLVENGVIDNSREATAKGKGYGLPGW